EKWEIASDKAGSGNTANIGSISNIDDLVNGRGVFEKLGEKHFDEYWMNHGTLNILAKDGSTKTMTSIQDYILYKGIEAELINHKAKRKASNKQ
ncbi:MAG: type II restriction endonuclease, partial [Calditrichota bacterium]